MVDVAPLPLGFPAEPIDAASLPTRPPHPLESWAEPSPITEPTIRRALPNAGYLDATPTALSKLADGEALVRRLGGTIRHAVDIAREREEYAAAEDARRRAQWPDPPGQLRAAEAGLAAAEAEALRHREAVDRGAVALAGARTRLAAVEAEQQTVRSAAAANMARSLATGEPLAELFAPVPDTATAERDVEVAEGALGQLKQAAEAAAKIATGARRLVYEAGNAVQIAIADDLAVEIEGMQAQLVEKRERLRGIAEKWTRAPRRTAVSFENYIAISEGVGALILPLQSGTPPGKR